MREAQREEKKLRTYLKRKLKVYPGVFINDIDWYWRKIEIWFSSKAFDGEILKSRFVVFDFIPPLTYKEDYRFYYEDELIKIYQFVRKILKSKGE